MTQSSFQESDAGLSQNEKIETHLTAHRGEWVPMPQLCEISGAYAVHSRCAELRTKGLQIENKTERHGNKTHSFYKLV